MNTDRLLELADYLERDTEHCVYDRDDRRFLDSVGNNRGFNLSTFQFECGAPGCIAGHACFRFFGEEEYYRKHGSGKAGVSESAARLLGLDLASSNRLFLPSSMTELSFNDVTPRKAAAVLRHLAETGEVDWSISPIDPAVESTIDNLITQEETVPV